MMRSGGAWHCAIAVLDDRYAIAQRLALRDLEEIHEAGSLSEKIVNAEIKSSVFNGKAF